MEYFLAIDIGASSGRHILASLEGGVLKTQEIYRFENGFRQTQNGLEWDTQALFSSVLEGIKECRRLGRLPKSVAIDTWGVDYVLLDRDKKEIPPAFCYRDSRTQSAIPAVEGIVSPEKHYAITGTQKQPFNTVYQLYSDKLSGRLQNAEYFLMMPEYLSFRLTGNIANEYTNASTTGLLNAKSRDWDGELLSALGIPKKLFRSPVMPPAALGGFKEEIRREVGFDCSVVLAPSHDTASAVAASPVSGGGLYISSGTWSLIGAELPAPVLTDEARLAGFTNEGGAGGRIRFLRNYMGMWLFQNIKRQNFKNSSYDDMMRLAEECEKHEIIDVNAPELFAPQDMADAVRSLMRDKNAEMPVVLNTLYHSLAESYRLAVTEMERITGRGVEKIIIVGGGSKDRYLNSLAAGCTGKPVFTGLTEATAAGNLLSQIMLDKGIELDEARKIIKKSFDIKAVQ